jgi:hypothetical protein
MGRAHGEASDQPRGTCPDCSSARIIVRRDLRNTPDVVVTGTNRRKTAGQLVRDVVVNKPGKKQGKPRLWSGVVTLATRHGNIEIDYLDIVWVERASKPLPGSPTTKKRRRIP